MNKQQLKIPVIALKNKSKEGRYLAVSMDLGDWDDPNLDVTINDIENAFMLWRKDYSKPDQTDIENLKAESKAHKKYMREKFGEDAIVSFDVEAWLEIYEPVNLEITREQFKHVLDIASM